MANTRRTKKRTPKKTGTAAKSKPAEPKLPKSAASSISKARAQYAALLREIELASIDEVRGWDRKWEAVGLVLSKKLFVLDDEAPTAAEWVEKHIGEKHRTAIRNARVAKIASPDEEKKYGVMKIDMAYSIELARRAAEAEKRGVEWTAPDEPLPIALDELRYAVVRDDKKVTVDLEAITQLELRAIQSGESRDAGAPSARVSPFLKRVLSHFNKRSGMSNVQATERDSAYSFSNVRRDQLEALGRALIELAREPA